MKFLREKFRGMTPYHSAYITEGIKLDANENPYPIPKEMTRHMQNWADTMKISRYPDTDSTKLVKAIAKAYDLEPEHVVCGVGSDELIDCIIRSTVDPDDYVLAPTPSFSMYPQFTTLNSGQLIEIPLREDFSYDVSGMIKAIKAHKPKVIFLCNPNNPTGSLLSVEEINEITQAAEGLVVVDEAYGEFCEITALPLIKVCDNIVILRTFSKAYALAGARVGYGMACKEIIDLINTVKVPYNLSMFSQEIGAWAIANQTLFAPLIEKIMTQRDQLLVALKALELTVYPSYANFIWLEMPEAAYLTLECAKIYIRKMQYNNQPYYRITVGTEKENAALLEVLTEYFKA